MAKIKIMTTSSFELAWCDKGSGGHMDGAFYNPVDIPIDYYSIGSYGQSNYNPPSGITLLVADDGDEAIKHPVDYTLVYKDSGSGANMDGSFWKPVPPDGYVAMGILCVSGYDKPKKSSVVCIRKDLVLPAVVGSLIWNDAGTGANMDGGFWNIDLPIGTPGIKTGAFAGASSHEASEAVPLYAIKNEAVR